MKTFGAAMIYVRPMPEAPKRSAVDEAGSPR
jgi:hypothetical protein